MKYALVHRRHGRVTIYGLGDDPDAARADAREYGPVPHGITCLHITPEAYEYCDTVAGGDSARYDVVENVVVLLPESK